VSMDRAERTGISASVGGHLLLFAVLWAAYLTVKPMPIPQRKAIEVSLVTETALESGAPQISQEAPAPKLAEDEKTPAEVTPPAPAPEPKPAPAPVPKSVAKPAPAPTPAKPVPAKPSGGRLAGILKGLSDVDTPSRSTAAPATTITPAIQSSLAAAIIRQIKPHWEGPSGPDVDVLKTVLKINLARDGSVTNIQFVGTTGINDSNRSIAPIHKERAIKAVRLASPFQLPANLYDGWKEVTVNFDWRL
jgi:outer membrane biosynthesis protein TonB